MAGMGERPKLTTRRLLRWAGLIALAVVGGVLIARFAVPPDSRLREIRANQQAQADAREAGLADLRRAYPGITTFADRAGTPGLSDTLLRAIADGHPGPLGFELGPILRGPLGPELAQRLMEIAEDAAAKGDMRTAGTVWVVLVMNSAELGLEPAEHLSLLQRVEQAELEPEQRTNLYGVLHSSYSALVLVSPSDPATAGRADEEMQAITERAATFLLSGDSPYPPSITNEALGVTLKGMTMVAEVRRDHATVARFAQLGLDTLADPRFRYPMHRSKAAALTKAGAYEDARSAYDALIAEAEADPEALGEYAPELNWQRFQRYRTYLSEGRTADFINAAWAEHDRANDAGRTVDALQHLAWQQGRLARLGQPAQQQTFDAAFAFVMQASPLLDPASPAALPAGSPDRLTIEAHLKGPVYYVSSRFPLVPRDQRASVARRVYRLIDITGDATARAFLDGYLD